MAIEAMGRQGNGQRSSVLTEEERAEVMRAIDEYDFISIVLKHKATLMPEDLVQELAQQNDATRETIVMSLSLEIPLSV